VVINGVGEGGLPATTTVALRGLAKRAREISVRDGASAAVLREWGVEAVVGLDLSAWLPAAPAAVGARLLRSAGIDPRRPVIGLALTAVNRDLAEAILEAAAATVAAMPDAVLLHPGEPAPARFGHNDAVLPRPARHGSPS
jgi:polysaccharide pyruvyl transferase WcaK-like protein